MSTVATTLRLNDAMTAPLTHIITASNLLLSTWESLDDAVTGGIDPQRISDIRWQLNKASQGLQEMTREQQEYNLSARSGSEAVSGLTGQILSMASAYTALRGLSLLRDLSDGYSRTMARLELINDGSADTAALYDQIAAFADRARASISDTADTVAKLSLNAGDAFGYNQETILFAENLGKLFKIAGTEQAAISSATLQLTQALGSGVLRGEEFNAVFEAAPNVMQTIADYMEVHIGQLRSMAAEGQITADIVKNALLGATKKINDQFNNIPMTWADVWIGITNRLYNASRPLLGLLSLLAQNWSLLEPIVLSGATALGLYAAVLLTYKGLRAAAALSETLHAAALLHSSGATFAATAAQQGLNMALLACPITWVVGGIVVFLGLLYAAVAWINKTRDSSISATGIITGVFSAGAAFVGNLFVSVWNLAADIANLFYDLFAAVANFLANVFVDPVGAVIRLFFDMADAALSILQSVASALDTVFGSDLASSVQGWRDSLSGWVSDTVGDGIEVFAKGDPNDFKLERFAYGDAYSQGYNFGQGLAERFGGFGAGGLDQTALLEQLGLNAQDIADNTGGISNALEISGENLKYLRDIAERETINRYTTAQIRVEMGGVTNNVSKDTDLDGVMDYFVSGIQEAAERAAEGVHP